MFEVKFYAYLCVQTVPYRNRFSVVPSDVVFRPSSTRKQQLQVISRELLGLTSLNLDSCDIGDVGVRALSSMTQLEVR